MTMTSACTPGTRRSPWPDAGSSRQEAEGPGDQPGGEPTGRAEGRSGHRSPDAIVARPMASSVKTNVTELPESRVRVQAEVAADEVERRMQQTARALGREMKIPGFRKGKVPPPVVLRRGGRGAVLDETLRSSLGAWYIDAIDAAGIAPIGDPDVALGDLPGEGEALTFSIEIGVRPTAELGEYRALEVGRREPEVDDEAVESEGAALRERLARLETAERPAGKGDFVVSPTRCRRRCATR